MSSPIIKPIFEDVDKNVFVPLHDRLKTYSMKKITKDEVDLERKIGRMEKSIESHNEELERKKKTLESLKADLDIIKKIKGFV